eukprot:CAMPEP_0119305444 /NCGR_PEP_ID=MMETSP1333-20130426/6452_1 /TAXON_ID=418940 /ORGANISM="Scyphosphaera apsteinii, Strain RCC1455" /LENGTH=766 /DNA_ID=CAMNT_0007308535 /DNA_START=48 /DNA_END=2348 /DNA_ORIENTATION=-
MGWRPVLLHVLLLYQGRLILAQADLLTATYQVKGHDNVEYEELSLDDPEFMWATLPGRCCFSSTKEWKGGVFTGKYTGAQTCAECTSWGQADVAYCHEGASACQSCGSNVYCDPPPALLAGNRICIGNARIGEGCFDDYALGVCMSKSIYDCNVACHNTLGCGVFVFYPKEKMGSCVLCKDLAESVLSTKDSTRAFELQDLRHPPSPPLTHTQFVAQNLAGERGYKVVGAPSPPPPPPSPPGRPSRPPRPLSHLGIHTKQHFQCTYFEETEFTVDMSTGYTDKVVSSQAECCNACGLKSGCQDFVFEPSSGACVLLPHVSDQSLVKSTFNELTVSGSLKIVMVARVHHAVCTFFPQSGYARGSIGEASSIPPTDHPVENKQDCCDACAAIEQCAKFSFSQDARQCILYQSTAERTLVTALIAGTVDERILESSRESGGNKNDIAIMSGLYASPPPLMPPLMLTSGRPSPPLPPVDEQATKDIVYVVSLAVAGVFVVSFTLCAYLFFSAQVFGSKGGAPCHVSSDHSPKKRSRDRRANTESCELSTDSSLSGSNEDDEEMGKDVTMPGSRRAKVGRHVVVTVKTKAITQKKEIDASRCQRTQELRRLILEEFAHILSNIKQREKNLLLLVPCNDRVAQTESNACGAGEGSSDDSERCDEGEEKSQLTKKRARWLLVTARSDVTKVLAVGELRMVEVSADQSAHDFEQAFEPRKKTARRDEACASGKNNRSSLHKAAGGPNGQKKSTRRELINSTPVASKAGSDEAFD